MTDRKFKLTWPLSQFYIYLYIYCDILKSPYTYFSLFTSLAILLEYALNTSVFERWSHISALLTTVSETSSPRKFYKKNFKTHDSSHDVLAYPRLAYIGIPEFLINYVYKVHVT